MVVINNLQKDLWEGLEHEKSVETPEIHKDGTGANKWKLNINWKVSMVIKKFFTLLCLVISTCTLGVILSACGDSNAVLLEANHFVHPYPQDNETWFEQSITILYNGECEVIKKNKDENGNIVTKQYFYELTSFSMDMVNISFGERFVEHQDVSRHQNEEQWVIKYYDKKGELIFDYSGLADNDALKQKFLTLSSLIVVPALLN